MDKNSAIGLTLIALLLLVYFYFFSPAPVPPDAKPVSKEIIIKGDSTAQKKPESIDSITAKQYGSLSSFLTGTESFTTVENDVLKLTFSNHATFNEVNLKKYKTYSQQPLNLVKGGNNSFSLFAEYEGRKVDLYTLHYQPETIKKGDTTFVSFTAHLSESAYLKHIYFIPVSGYQIGYRIESQGVTLNGKEIGFS